MNGNSIRVGLLTATALLTLVVVMISADRGATAGQTLDEACAGAVWPAIPTQCFGRDRDSDIYPAAIAVDIAQVSSVDDRSPQLSAIGAAGKVDLFHSPESDSSEYRTVETRSDGVSVLMRVKAE